MGDLLEHRKNPDLALPVWLNMYLPQGAIEAGSRKLDHPYAYSGIEAWSYDLVDELSQFEDFGFYRLLLESSPGRVLDLGCGTGRILLGLKEQGIDVVGLDASPEMLRQCREKLSAKELEAELFEGDMRTFDLGQTFATILIPGFSILLLAEDDDLKSCLQRCYQHLIPGGQLIVSTYFPREFLESGKEGEGLVFRSESESAETEERVRAFQGWSIDRDGQLLKLQNRFQRLDQRGGIIDQEDREMTLRWRSTETMEKLFEDACFGEISCYGEFDFAEPRADAESIVLVALRPESHP